MVMYCTDSQALFSAKGEENGREAEEGGVRGGERREGEGPATPSPKDFGLEPPLTQ